MKNWGNWSYSELAEVVERAKAEKRKVVIINQEHTDWRNDAQVERWLAEMKVEFRTEMERTTIFL